MKKVLFPLFLTLSFCLQAQVYKNAKAPIESRVADLVSRMTLEEKIILINGLDWMYTHPIERLGVPSFKMSDGPTGANTHGKSTAYPASILTAASWDVNLAKQLGIALGRDCRSRGVNFLLGPGVNIARAPMCGRNFEYLGEDPFLSSSLVSNTIKGIQSQGVVATVKHFAANNQEYDRNNISSDIDERTLQEIYLPAFKAAVQIANVGAVMSSYNLLNGVQASHNKHLNIEILRKQWGFKGILMSDWGSVHEGIAAFNGGEDLEMPGDQHMIAKNLLPALQSGEIKETDLNEKVCRILRIFFRYGFFDRPQIISSIPNDDPTSVKTALELARGGIVLLKNQDNILPLKPDKIKRIAVIGPNADTFITGGGSSRTTPFHSVSTLEGLKQAVKGVKGTEVNYTMGIPNLNYLCSKSVFYSEPGSTTTGLRAEYFNNKYLSDTPKAIRVDKIVNNEWVQTPSITGIGEDNFSVRWTGVVRPSLSSKYKFTVQGDDGYRLWVNNEKVIDFWSDHSSIAKSTLLQLEAGKEYSIKLEYYESDGDASISLAWFQPQDENFNDAIELAKSSDVAFVCVGFNQELEREAIERPFEIPSIQDSLIRVVSNAIRILL